LTCVGWGPGVLLQDRLEPRDAIFELPLAALQLE
jgi:hypothetical protein